MVAQAEGGVSLSIYWQRPVAFDENGRAQRSVRSELSWHNKLVQDIFGIYHIGVVAYGVEYSFGNTHAPHSQQLGGRVGGIVRHAPTQAGPHNVFKQSVHMGSICVTADHVAQIAERLSVTDFGCKSYSRFQHNCADFAHEFCSQIGVKNEFPSWCRRGSEAAKLMGLGRHERQTKLSSNPPQCQDLGNALAAIGLSSSDLDVDALAEFMEKQNQSKASERPTLLTSRAVGPRHVKCNFLKCQQASSASMFIDFDSMLIAFEDLPIADERETVVDIDDPATCFIQDNLGESNPKERYALDRSERQSSPIIVTL